MKEKELKKWRIGGNLAGVVVNSKQCILFNHKGEYVASCRDREEAMAMFNICAAMNGTKLRMIPHNSTMTIVEECILVEEIK